MRKSSHDLVSRLYRESPFMEPILDIGGVDTDGWKGIPTKTMEIDRGEYVADITCMPQIADGSVGTYICLDVFEHCKAPWKAAKELHRTLTPGGMLILSTPFIWDYHAYPEDYWRFSVDALRLLCEDFREMECGWMEESTPLGLNEDPYEKFTSFKLITLPRSCSYFVGKK